MLLAVSSNQALPAHSIFLQINYIIIIERNPKRKLSIIIPSKEDPLKVFIHYRSYGVKAFRGFSFTY